MNGGCQYVYSYIFVSFECIYLYVLYKIYQLVTKWLRRRMLIIGSAVEVDRFEKSSLIEF